MANAKKTQLSEEDATFKWIPCSSGRLPKTNGYYLTTTAYGEVYRDYWSGVNFDRTEMVIAWMPLPAPYKGDTDGKD